MPANQQNNININDDIIKKLFETINHPKTLFISIFIIQISLGIYFGITFYERNLLEQTISKEMKQFEGSTLYVLDIDVALQGRKMAFNYKNLWKEKYTNYEKNALVLVNEKQLIKQWKGKNPMLNWGNIETYYKIHKLKSFQGDFNLFRIDSKK